MRRLPVVLLLVAVLVAIAWWLFRWQERSVVAADPWSAVPPTTALVLDVQRPLDAWGRFTGTAQLWGAMERMPGPAAVHALLGRLAFAATEDPDLVNALGDAHVLVTIPAEQSGGCMVIAAIPATSARFASVGPALGVDLSSGSAIWRRELLTTRPDSALPELHVAFNDGLLFLATDPGLISAAREQQLKPVVDSTLTTLRATLGHGADAHLLVQPGRAARALARWLDPKAIADLTVPEGWAALDVRLRPDVVLLSGLLGTTTPTPALAALDHQTPDRHGLHRVLPARAHWFRSVAVSDVATYLNDRHADDAPSSYMEAYSSWVQGNIALATAYEPGGARPAQWAVMQCSDPLLTEEALKARCTSGKCEANSYRGITITRLPDGDALAAVYGKEFDAMRDASWALLGDMVVFTTNPGWMREAIDAWTDGSSLAVDARNGRFFQRFASSSGLSWWSDGARSFAPLRAMANAGTRKGMDAWVRTWQTLGGFLLEVSPDKPGLYQLSVCLQHAPIGATDSEALWTASVGGPVAKRPWLLKDHLSNTLLLLTQRNDHRVDLVSCTGKVLWQRELDGPILGEVHQVDRYKNGKLQMVFNTPGRLYMIDRNGQDVEGFPVAIGKGSSAPVAVMDYDANREYRLLVPDSAGAVLNFTAEGKPVQGWNSGPLPAPAVAPVVHYRIAGKDVLLMACADGSVQASDRRGDERRPMHLTMPGLQQVLAFREGRDLLACRVIWTDTAGTTLTGTMAGMKDTLVPTTSSAVVLLDPGPRGGNRLVVIGRDSVLLNNGRERERVLAFPEAGNDPDAAFGVQVPGAGTLLGTLRKDREQVRLYTADGKSWGGAAVRGAVPFRVADINMDGVLELVTATGDGQVIAYPLAPAQ